MEWKRTVYSGNVSASNDGEHIILNGWVDRIRDHGKVLFLDLRDRTGVVQCVIDSDDTPLLEKANDLNQEDCVAVKGTVQKRPDDMVNPEMNTGEIELSTDAIHRFSTSEPLPFPVEEEVSVDTELRLKHRYLDLRRPSMHDNLKFRYETVKAIRQFFYDREFSEIETPYLVKETPGGARSFIVPSRQDPGNFFALAESPQVYKQLLMVSGYERYFQIVKCFRDEDLRKDRQPEFTQLDMEMSFINEEDVIQIMEDCMEHVMEETLNHSITPPFPRLDYREAMDRFGTDKPDLRFGLEITDISETVRDSEFNIFSGTVQDGGVVRGLAVPKGKEFSRSDIDELETRVQGYGLPGLAWCRVESETTLDASIAQYLSEEEHENIIEEMNASPGDLLLFVAADWERAATALGGLRTHLGELLNLVDEGAFEFLWVVNFPLFEKDHETEELHARHHPFTSPQPEDEDQILEEPENVKARAYDLVLNGFEIAGGSIRVHKPSLQEKIFKALGMSEEEIEEKFSFLVKALNFGAPPHGGIALGVDRFVMALKKLSSIRECIPFPRTGNAYDPMSESPSPVSSNHLKELGIQLLDEVKRETTKSSENNN